MYVDDEFIHHGLTPNPTRRHGGDVYGTIVSITGAPCSAAIKACQYNCSAEQVAIRLTGGATAANIHKQREATATHASLWRR